MDKKKNMTRRNFIGTAAASGAGTILMAGSRSTAEGIPAFKNTQAKKNVYYFGYGSNLNVSATIKDLIPK